MIALNPGADLDMLPAATDEYAGARGNLGATVLSATVVLAQSVGCHHWMDGGRQSGDLRGYRHAIG